MRTIRKPSSPIHRWRPPRPDDEAGQADPPQDRGRQNATARRRRTSATAANSATLAIRRTGQAADYCDQQCQGCCHGSPSCRVQPVDLDDTIADAEITGVSISTVQHAGEQVRAPTTMAAMKGQSHCYVAQGCATSSSIRTRHDPAHLRAVLNAAAMGPGRLVPEPPHHPGSPWSDTTPRAWAFHWHQWVRHPAPACELSAQTWKSRLV